MIRLISLIFFLGCAMAVGRYYHVASALQLGVVLALAGGLTFILGRRRTF